MHLASLSWYACSKECAESLVVDMGWEVDELHVTIRPPKTASVSHGSKCPHHPNNKPEPQPKKKVDFDWI